jgi:hypothetical protein
LIPSDSVQRWFIPNQRNRISPYDSQRHKLNSF